MVGGESTGVAVVGVYDLPGRLRGLAFPTDRDGTLLTSHEAVDGLRRLVLHVPGEESTQLVEAGGITPLPAYGLAVVRAPGVGRRAPILLAGGWVPEVGAPVRVALPDGMVEGRVAGVGDATYIATDAFHLIDPVLELALDASPYGPPVAGAPVLDPATGAVLAVLGTSLHGSRGARSYALLPRGGPCAELAGVAAVNGAAVPGFGRDLNLAGVRRLAGEAQVPPGYVERADVRAGLDRFLAGDAPVLALVGAPGSGRSTELAALARRCPAPAVRIRGAALRLADAGVRDALARVLGAETPESAAAVARTAGQPLLVLLDGPEEMPPVLARDLAAWSTQTGDWLRLHGVRLIVGCRPEFWESARHHFAQPLPQHGESGIPAVRLDDLTPRQAAQVRTGYGIPDLPADAARHPLSLRLLADVRGALPKPPDGSPGRHEILQAWLDLACLRAAEQLERGDVRPTDVRPTGVRHTAARIAGRVHEAARRCLGPGQGELDRPAFEELFPWPEGVARAVLDAGLLEAAGAGYRFAHEELGEWLQGAHLDLDAALAQLTGPGAGSGDPRTAPVPPHRIGPLVHALLLVGHRHGAAALRTRLAGLVEATARPPAAWWASRLLVQTLLRLPDATPQLPVLRLLAERLCGQEAGPYAPQVFAPAFWTALRLAPEDTFDLLRPLVAADPSASFPAAVAALLRADPAAVQPLLVRWFRDERPAVADAAQALLHTHRDADLDALTDTLADAAHPRADRLLAALCAEEPAALCRAVDRWAHDPRAERHTAAAVYGRHTARHAAHTADRDLLGYAARTLLALPAEPALHGAALAILVHDPRTRPAHLAHALARYGAGDPHLTAADFGPALPTHPGPVLAAFRVRLDEPGSGAAEVLRTLARIRTPAVARRAAALAGEYAARHPEGAAAVAAFVDLRLDHGPEARAVLQPLAVELLRTHPPGVRRALAPVLAAPGAPQSRPLRRELLAVLLAAERDAGVLDVLLTAVAEGAGQRAPRYTYELLDRLAELLDTDAFLDARLGALAQRLPAFRELLRARPHAVPAPGAPAAGRGSRPAPARESPRRAG
ncbi:serine protease [Streptomyces polyrhachis]|uniref:Serine protease n=1 Tax=Streptomyces polyrhachis TaxID=1282885 RepID=A0ABW2GFH3_9ACTN